VLTRFDADVAFLTAIELPPRLTSPNRTLLSDLLDTAALRDVATRCARSHRHFAARVADFKALHAALCSEVEAVFMCAPAVDLEDLAATLEGLHTTLERHEAVVRVTLEGDAGRVRALLDAAQEGAGAGALSETVSVLEEMHDAHTKTILPELVESREAFEGFAERCVACKVRIRCETQGVGVWWITDSLRNKHSNCVIHQYPHPLIT
jgi:hypothetical protein